MAILMLLYISNIVFAGISFKYTRRNGEKYSEGQKFLKVFTLILGITAVLNFVLAILQYNSILLLVLCLILTIAFVVSMMSLINDLKKNKLSQKI